MNRWLADGSRIFPDEVDGVFAPRNGPPHIIDAVGDRHINESRYVGFELVLGMILDAGSKVIAYSPPLHPIVFDDPRQAAAVKAACDHFRPITERHQVDYCDLSAEAASLGCEDRDFFDEHHISRRCNQRIVKRLATGCAPRAGAMLKEMLTPEALE
jgi:hypothetical protein